MSSILPAHTLSFFNRVNLVKITEMSSGVEECTIPARARDKIFPSPDRMVLQHLVGVAESCVRSCVGILLYIKLLKKFIMSPVTWKRTQWVQRGPVLCEWTRVTDPVQSPFRGFIFPSSFQIWVLLTNSTFNIEK